MKVADFVIKYLADKGVSDMFAVYGSACGDLIDAFTRVPNTTYRCCQHEQAAGFAAEGWAKIKGCPGCAIATSGPGGTNLLTAIANCYYDSVPAIFLTGQINSKFLRPCPEIRQVGFQENDIVSMAKPVTKMAEMVRNPQDIYYWLDLAWERSITGRKGPCLLDIPMDVQKTEIVPNGLLRRPCDWFKTDTDDFLNTVDKFLEDLGTAQRPAILVGGGVNGSASNLLKMASLLQIPMFPTWNALDIVTSDNPYYGGRVGTYGGDGRNFAIQNCDLLLCLGCRISGRITGGNPSSFARGAKKYVVDIDPHLVKPENQQICTHRNICCDCGKFIAEIIRRNPSVPSFSNWFAKVRQWKAKYDPVLSEHFDQKDFVHPYAFLRILSEETPFNATIVGDCGGNIVSLNHSFRTKLGQRFLTNNGNSPMGFSMAGAIGAYFADPSRPIICVIGDGGMQVNIQELQTIKYYSIPLKIFILNNHCYGITRQYQRTNFEGRQEACGPKGYSVPNFMAIANAYGLDWDRIIANPCKFSKEDIVNGWRSMIRYVLGHRSAFVVDVDCGDFDTYEPRIAGWNTPIEDMFPYLLRDEFRANMEIDPLPGWEVCDYGK